MQYYAMCKHPTNPMAYNKASCVFAVGALVSCYTNNCVKVMCVWSCVNYMHVHDHSGQMRLASWSHLQTTHGLFPRKKNFPQRETLYYISKAFWTMFSCSSSSRHVSFIAEHISYIPPFVYNVKHPSQCVDKMEMNWGQIPSAIHQLWFWGTEENKHRRPKMISEVAVTVGTLWIVHDRWKQNSDYHRVILLCDFILSA